jgi:hypothetical protein
MSLWTDLKDGVRKVILMEDRLERMSIEQKTIAAQIVDHDRRLVRIETMIEMSRGAEQRRLPPNDR